MQKNSSTLFMGGLGNMLFQTAMLYSYSKKFNYNFLLNYSHVGTLHNPPVNYKNNIFRNFNFINNSGIEWSLYEEPLEYKPCKYNELTDFNVKNLLFKGFFQSYKYFNLDEKEIQAIFSPTSDILDYINNKYNPQNYISLHVRRGDYTKLSEHHHNLDLKYYKNAIDYFNGNKFLIFSDDINWCKKHFKGEEFTFVENEEDYIDLYIMSQCKHNIIANSTFSWWGAYLNPKPNKIVIHPDKWFGKINSKLDISDLFPPTWICLPESVPKTTINLMGKVCSHLTKPNKRWSTVHTKISSDVKITRNENNFNGITIFSDDTIESNLVNTINSPNKIGWLMETREVAPQRYDNFENYKNNYNFIMTHDNFLLKKYPEKTKFIPFGGCWIKDSNFNIYPKTKLISMVLSDKKYLKGHKIRHEIFKSYLGIDYYGRGTNNPIEYKEASLKDYYFSIVIENSKTNNYFTEKLLDCFATGTIPIYWGCSNISDFFNPEGIININNVNDINNILSYLTPEYYNSKINAINENLLLSKNYKCVEDWMYKNILKNE